MTLDLDDYLRHTTYIDRLATGALNSQVYPSLDAAYKAIRAIIADKGVPTTPAQLDALTKAIRKQIESDKAWATITTDMEQMAVYESAYQAKLMGEAFAATLAVPKDSKIVDWVSKSIMSLTSGQRVDAGAWSDFVTSNLSGRAQTINSIVANGYAKGQTVGQLTKSIGEAFDGIIKRDAESLARTGFAHYASEAGEAMIQDNADILEEYFYVVTFDSRTSDICIGVTKFNETARRFSVGDPKAPFPPLHYQCRTRRIGVPNGWEPQGTKAAVGGKKGEDAKEAFEKRKDKAGDKKIRYRGKKDSSIFKAGQIDASLTYDQWLRTQPSWFVADTLGAKRAELFQKGAPLSSFSDMTGRPLTLKEIQERNPIN